jgi:hypothetical protein
MKMFFILLISLFLYGCTKESVDPTNSKDLKISIDYAFPVISGDMTPKGSSTSYLNFYNKYIVGKILTPKTYNINFVNLENNYQWGISGLWGAHDLISVPPGKYRIFGDSRAVEDCSDVCSFTFSDTIIISSVTVTLTLKARYACSLLLLDTTNIGRTQFSTTHPNPLVITKGMMKTEDLYHSFISDQVNSSGVYSNYSIDLWIANRPDIGADFGTGMSISITGQKWQLGKYYYIENTGNGYIVPPMTGN